jgi:hypothetical protein
MKKVFIDDLFKGFTRDIKEKNDNVFPLFENMRSLKNLKTFITFLSPKILFTYISSVYGVL